MKKLLKDLGIFVLGMTLFSGCASSSYNDFVPETVNGVSVVKNDNTYSFDGLPNIPKTERDSWYMKSAVDEVKTEVSLSTTNYITVDGITSDTTGIIEYNGNYYYYDADKKQVLNGVLCIEGDNYIKGSFTTMLNRTYYCTDENGVLTNGTYLCEDNTLNLGVSAYDIVHFSINEEGKVTASNGELQTLIHSMSSNVWSHPIKDDELPELFENTLKDKSKNYHYLVYSDISYYVDSHNLVCPSLLEVTNDDIESSILNDNWASLADKYIPDFVWNKIQENTKEWYLISEDGSDIHTLTKEEKTDLGNALRKSAIKGIMGTVYSNYIASDALNYTNNWGYATYNLYLSDSTIADSGRDLNAVAKTIVNVVDSNKLEITGVPHSFVSQDYRVGLAIYDGEFKYYDKVTYGDTLLFTINVDEINSDLFRLYIIGDASTVVYDIDKSMIKAYWDKAKDLGLSEIAYNKNKNVGILESTLLAGNYIGSSDDCYKLYYKGEPLKIYDKETKTYNDVHNAAWKEYRNAVQEALDDLTNRNKNLIDSKEDYELLKEWQKELFETRVFEIEVGYDYLDRLLGKKSTLNKTWDTPVLSDEELSSMPDLLYNESTLQ